jgi:hypothetical protein
VSESKRPMTVAQMIAHNERALAARRADAQAERRPQDPGPSPADQRWHEARLWNGETTYVPGSGPSNDWVRHQYNPLDALVD